MRLCVGLFALYIVAFARGDAIDNIVREAMAKQHIPGAVIAIVRPNAPDRISCYGVSNLELGTPCKPESVFMLASVSKQFVATAIMLLQQNKKLSVSEEISKYFPDAPETWKGIRIRHLMSHTSGLAREIPGWSPNEIFTDDQLESMAMKTAIEFPVGTKYQYSNTAYFLLGFIVKKVSGISYAEFLRSSCFDPLNMSSTRTTSMSAMIPNRVDSYDYVNNEYENDSVLLSVRTSGSFVASALDLVKWEYALQKGAPLTHESIAAMQEQTLLADGKLSNYGFGWQVDRFQNRLRVHHSGGLLGFRTHYMRFPQDRIAIIVLTNCSTSNARQISESIANAVFDARFR